MKLKKQERFREGNTEYSGIPISRTSKGNENWFEKWESSRNRDWTVETLSHISLKHAFNMLTSFKANFVNKTKRGLTSNK